VVKRSFCAACTFADHEPLPKLPLALPCLHLGTLAKPTKPRSQKQPAGPALFSCAVHGQCNVEDNSGRGPYKSVRCCGSCSDYLPRDPFGPTSMQMAAKADAFLDGIPAYPAGRYQGRGIVIAGGGKRFFASLYVTIRAIRHVGCRLPIQVWYLGSAKEMPPKQQALLKPFDVECVDGDKVRQEHPAQHLGGWELKVFATLHCPFEEVLFLDADCYPCRNPEFLFELADYQERGAIFWPDIVVFDKRIKWAGFGMKNPGRPGSVESGQYVIHKQKCWQPLNLAWFYNDHSDYYYRYGFGDKHTFEAAWNRCGASYAMWDVKAYWSEVAYKHRGPDHLPLFVHRCSDKFRLGEFNYTTGQKHRLPSYHSSLPLERECWEWFSEIALRVGARPSIKASLPALASQSRSRFAVATLYARENAELGQMAEQSICAYAKRHGYQAIIARTKIDLSRPVAWSKLLLIDFFLSRHPDCEWLLWLDPDAVIVTPDKKLETFITKDMDFLIPEDLPPSRFNTGVFLIRNCPAALDMIRRAFAKEEFIHHPYGERPAIAAAIGECTENLRARAPAKNGFYSLADEYSDGTFIAHFEGYDPEAKLTAMKDMRAKGTLPVRSFVKPHQSSEVEVVRSLLSGSDGLPAGASMSPVPNSAISAELPPIFCITCWQTPQNTRLAQEHFIERGLKVQFFPGIHGRTFGLRTAYRHPARPRMLAGEVGCLLSHYMLWQALALLPYEEVMILEDDAWFPADFQKRFIEAYAELPKDWQFVFVGAVLMEGRPLEMISERIGIMRYPCGVHAYLVKRSALPFLLQSNHQARQPVDLQLREYTLPALKCYTFIPSLSKQRSAATATDGTGENWPTTSRIPDGDYKAS
jgi:GR25 family glycosyltransferase involved in LPS biosynthesis